ncbi:MAG: transposase [Planctomycetota bacterium]
MEKFSVGDFCPGCGGKLESKGSRSRTALECMPLKVENIIYKIERKWCPHCKKAVEAALPGVLPKSKYGNQLLAHVATEHYVNGRTLGQIEKETGAGCGSLLDSMHQLAKRFEKVSDKIVKEYRRSSVKHADETGWRNNGENGYAWLFCTDKISIFRFRKTRPSAVPKEVLGTKKLPGVLIVDRYAGYNKVVAPLAT